MAHQADLIDHVTPVADDDQHDHHYVGAHDNDGGDDHDQDNFEDDDEEHGEQIPTSSWTKRPATD